MKIRSIVSCVMLALTCLASPAWAQTGGSGSIAGTVRDTSGAVLPGVTVEAASPALIEKVRTVVTDEQGAYRIVDLRPGTYTVSFSLAGFSTFKREGIELSAGFTAPVTAELKVGDIAESITVTGATPVVDVQNVRTQQVISQQLFETVPVGRTFQGLATLTLGVMTGTATGASASTTARDVGGVQPDGYFNWSIHGAPNDGRVTVDGAAMEEIQGDGSRRNYQINPLAVQEMVMETGGQNAENPTGGMQIKVVLKDGGNQFSGTVLGNYTNRNFVTANLSDSLRARGVTATDKPDYIYEIGGSLGGPIKRDKLWFFYSPRYWGVRRILAGVYYNATPETHLYVPNLDRPADPSNVYRDQSVRFTWQATPKDKFTLTGKWMREYQRGSGMSAAVAPEASFHSEFLVRPFTVTWTRPASNKLLFEAAFKRQALYQINYPMENTLNTPVQDLTAGRLYGSRLNGLNPAFANPTGGISQWVTEYGPQGATVSYNMRATMSYVTGAHAFKIGFMNTTGHQDVGGAPLYDVRYEIRNGLPVSLTQVAAPSHQWENLKADLGIFAQDQWTLRRLTLTGGVRFDYLNAYTPEQTRPAGRFLGELHFDPVYNVPNWKDVSARGGAAYDLFGTGRTSLKVALGKYMVGQATGLAIGANPVIAVSAASNRTWNDVNGCFEPDCNLLDVAANGECGPSTNRSFGTPAITTHYSDDFLVGSGVRPYNWQFSTAVQQELRPGVGLTAGYFRTWYGNFAVLDNLATVPSDFSQYCITAPTDPRLPTSGSQLCGLYDVSPARLGQINNLVVLSDDFGDHSSVYNGVEANLTARFNRGALLSGGISTGRTVTDTCYAVDAPARPDFCRVVFPFAAQTQVKFSGVYPLPWWGLQTSATFQNYPGIPINATRTYSNAEIAPSLGRNLAACGAAAVCTATATLSLLPPNTLREPRQSQLDVRFTKTVMIGGARLQGNFDVYNVFNASDVLGLNATYGATWQRPISVLTGRLFKFGGQFNF